MKRAQTKFLFFCAAVLIAAGAFFFCYTKRSGRAIEPVQAGDTKMDVLSKLGQPTAIFTNDFVALKYGGEVWAYGKKVDADAALRRDFPFKLRLFAPQDDDLLVFFNPSGMVKALKEPRR